MKTVKSIETRLEKLIDGHSLWDVLGALEAVCARKSSVTADVWQRVAGALSTVRDKEMSR